MRVRGEEMPRLSMTAGWLFALLCCLAAGLPSLVYPAEIAVLKSADIAAYNQAVTGLKADLPGSTTVTEYDMQGDVTRGRKLARKIRASSAGTVIAVGLKAALVAKLEIVDVPVIYCMVLDPGKYDLASSNMTGISLTIPVERQFDVMHDILPAAKQIGVLYDPEKTGQAVEDARRIAKALGLRLVERQVTSEKNLPEAVRDLLPQTDALWLLPDSTILTEESLGFVLAAALDRNVPVIGFSSEFVRNGALIGLSVSAYDIGRQAAAMAKQIMKGLAATSSLAVPPTRVRLAINLKIAKFLGITVPQDVINRADEVY